MVWDEVDNQPMTIAVVAKKNSNGLLKLSSPGGARLVQRLVSLSTNEINIIFKNVTDAHLLSCDSYLHQLDHKDGKVLKAARGNGDRNTL